jgi:hypothetical protein
MFEIQNLSKNYTKSVDNFHVFLLRKFPYHQLISHILPPEQALCQLLCIWYWLNGSTFHRLRADIIMIKYLAVAAVAKLISRFNFAYRVSCLSLAYPVGKLYLTDDTRSRLTSMIKW